MRGNRRTIFSFVLLILVILVLAVLMVRNRANTINSFTEIANNIYVVDYSADYELDEVLRSGIYSEEQLNSFLSESIYFSKLIATGLPELGCGAFAARNYNKQTIAGRNVDGKDTAAIVYNIIPRSGYRSIAVATANSVNMSGSQLSKSNFSDKLSLLSLPYLAIDGINEKGVFVTLVSTSSKNHPDIKESDKTPIMPAVAMRAILDKCANVDEAKLFLRKYDMTFSDGKYYDIFIADKSNDSVLADYCSGKLIFRETNKAVDKLTADNKVRYDYMEEDFRKSRGLLSDSSGMFLLSNLRKDETSDMPTRWSTLYNLNEKCVYISTNGNFKNAAKVKMKNKKESDDLIVPQF
ncbi:MAG: linear amide C-N hydrolase [Firmicutes bacterium]|nr:linear amide C-N hydrolase [Bacillota bacterium]